MELQLSALARLARQQGLVVKRLVREEVEVVVEVREQVAVLPLRPLAPLLLREAEEVQLSTPRWSPAASSSRQRTAWWV